MTKLKSTIQYECMTSARYIPIFYAIEYAVVILVTVMIGIFSGSFENGGTSALEINSLIYVSVLGALGFHEDFKMLIQNGFTRTYIFAAAVSLFCFMCGIMSFVDAVIGNLLHRLLPRYDSLYGAAYGYDHFLANWLWLFTLYLLMCCLLYLIALVIHRIGKHLSLYVGIVLGGIIVLIAAFFRYVLPREAAGKVLEFLMNVMGFMSDGTVNHLLPALTFLVLACVFGAGAYAAIRGTELP